MWHAYGRGRHTRRWLSTSRSPFEAPPPGRRIPLRSPSPYQQYNPSEACVQVLRRQEKVRPTTGASRLTSMAEEPQRPMASARHSGPPLCGATRPVARGCGRPTMRSHLGRCDLIVPRADGRRHRHRLAERLCGCGTPTGGSATRGAGCRPVRLRSKPVDRGRGVPFRSPSPL
jgi:hypothetical protein